MTRINGAPRPSPATPRPKPSRKARKFVVFELIGTRTGKTEEDVRWHLPKGRVFKVEELKP